MGDEESMNDLLDELNECVTDEDNEMLSKIPDELEIKKVITTSNLKSAPGRDGIPLLFYFACWDIVGDFLVKVLQKIHEGSHPTRSQNLSICMFGSKANKHKSYKPSDK